jgi:uncharacterized protein (DUF488 family)
MKMNTKVKLFTIGFTKRSAQDFFGSIKKNKVKTLIDIRLNNVSQLAGYTKREDLKYFLEAICNVNYMHITDLAPTEIILKKYRNKEINWGEYERLFTELLKNRKPEKAVNIEILENACLLCSETTTDFCHRRLVADYFKDIYKDIEIIHI